MESTLPQRLGLILLAKVPGIVDGRVIDQDFRAVGKDTLDGVIPGARVEVRDAFGNLRPLIVIDDLGPDRPIRTHSDTRYTRVAVWIFHPTSRNATRKVLALRDQVDGALDGVRDRMPPDSPHFPDEGTGGLVRFVDGIGTITDGEAVYDRIIFRVSHVRLRPRADEEDEPPTPDG